PASQRVIVGDLRYGDDRDGRAEQATPFLHVVERAGARAIRVELYAEVPGDQFDVATLVDGREVWKDGGQCRDWSTGAPAILRGSKRRDGRGIDPAAQRDDILTCKAARHSLPQQFHESVPDIGRAEARRLEQLGRVPVSSCGAALCAVDGEGGALRQTRHTFQGSRGDRGRPPVENLLEHVQVRLLARLRYGNQLQGPT